MPIQVVFGAAAVAVAVPLLLYSLAAQGSRWPLGRRQSALESELQDVRQLVLTRSPWDRLGRPVFQSLGSTLRRVSPKGWVDKLDRNLRLAGLSGRASVERVLVAKVALATGLFLFGWFGPISDMSLGWLLTLTITGVGFALPDLWLSRKAEDRQHRIEIELPDVIDQITMSVEAGLGFEAAVARAARVGDGPLAEELGRMIQEMQLGMSRSEALRNLADRTDVADLRSFVVTVIQSEQYGLSITKVLEVQAEELRDKRRQRSEERALRIPVLLIFPLALCIFPTILIILMGPAVLRMQEISIIAPGP